MPIFRERLEVTNPDLLLRVVAVKNLSDNFTIQDVKEVLKKRENKEHEINNMFPINEITKLSLEINYEEKLKQREKNENIITQKFLIDEGKKSVDYLYINNAEHLEKIKNKAKEIIKMFPKIITEKYETSNS